MRPIIKWSGGKYNELSEVLPFIPPTYELYIEPFFGGGALYFHLAPQRAILGDINKRLTDFYKEITQNWEVVHADLDKLESEFESASPQDRETMYYLMRDYYNGIKPTSINQAALFYYINKMAYGGLQRVNKKGEFNVPFGRYKTFKADRITQAHRELLSNAFIQHADFECTLSLATEKDFVFLDPPYDCTFTNYGNEKNFDQAEHERLANAFYNSAAKILLVISKTELTSRLYEKNVVHEYKKTYSVNIKNRNNRCATHMLVTNYKL